MDNYSNFSEVYDILTSNIDYRDTALYFDSIIKEHNVAGNLLVDLACGTGSLAEEFVLLGYDVIGIDNSYGMLSRAMDKKLSSNSNILYIKQDISNINLYGNVDVMICALDSINHITSKRLLQNLFDRVHLFLNKNGLFIFDVNTIFKHQFILKDNIFIYDMDEVYCVWQNSLAENNIVNIELNIFKKEDDNYIKLEENFSERAYSIDEIKEFIEYSNLKLINIYDNYSYNAPKKDSQRLVFVVKKE